MNDSEDWLLYTARNGAVIYGAKTLERYTSGILLEGFQKISDEAGQERCENTLFQIHGSQEASKDDDIILRSLEGALVNSANTSVVVLLHRPDEIQDTVPKLKEVLSQAKELFGLVFLGDKHVDDEFYDVPFAKKVVIPHGFFDGVSKKGSETKNVVIGTHTTWGDMRKPEHVLSLLGEVFARNAGNKHTIVYLGGKPADALQIELMRSAFTNLFPDSEVDFQPAQNFKSDHTYTGGNVIFIDDQNQKPEDIDFTFNMQLYYYGDRVRTGESSGSLHAAAGIPVILEMNGSERIEQLNVIKVPYDTATMAIHSADFAAAASQIVATIADGSYLDSIENNLKQAQRFDNKYVAKQLNSLFHELCDG